MKKRFLLIPLILLAVVIFAIAATGSKTSYEPASEEFREINYQFHPKKLSDKPFYGEFPYSDVMLLGDANVFSGDIAKASMGLAAAAYEREYVESALNKMGFGIVAKSEYIYNYCDKQLTIDDNDYVAYTIGYHTVEYQGTDYRIYCIPIRGTHGNAEWFSNFNLGEGTVHEGFRKAAEDVYSVLMNRLNLDQNKPGVPVFWLTGHSRGAAVANLLSGWLVERGVAPANHVFGYTFACPAVTKAPNTAMRNIYNFNDPCDLIPLLPQESWGYGRNGVTINKWSGNLAQNYQSTTDAMFLDNLSFRFEKTANKPIALRSRSSWQSALNEVAPDVATFRERKPYFTIAAYYLGGNKNCSLVDLVKNLGYQVLDIWADQLLQITDFDNAKQVIQQKNAEYREAIDLANQMIEDMRDMDAKERKAYLSAHSSDVSKLSKFAGKQITELSDLTGLVTNLIDIVQNGEEIAGALVSAGTLFFDGQGNVLDALNHGHNPLTYVSWINGLYCGYHAWADYTDPFILDTQYVKTIGDGCCQNASNLMIADIDDVTFIGPSAFSGCSRLESVDIGKVEQLKEYVFYGCSGLKEITLPVDLNTSIYYQDSHSNKRFDGCTNIETIHYTKGKTGVMLDRQSSDSYSDLYYTTTPEHIAREHLSSVDFAEGITHIGDYTFYGSGNVLKSVKLPSTLESIGKYAFHNQTGLTDMVLPAGIKSFGACALCGCSSLQDFEITSQVTEIGASSFAGCPGLKAVTFNPSIETIPYGCFSGCTGLTELVIPDTVTALGNYAFRDCTGLKELTVPVDLFTGYKVNEYGGNDYYGRFPGCKNIETIHYTKGQTGVMPDRITESGDMNYSYMPEHVAQAHLSSVDFAEGITHIGDYAFYGSGNVLKSVKLPSTLESIGKYAFHNQTGLTDMVLPAGIKSFGDYALSNCRSLQDFTISDQVTGIGVYSFAGCPGLKAVTFNPSIATIPEGCFSGCTGLTELVIPDTVTALGNYAFRDCTGLKELTVPVDLFTGYKINEYGGNGYYGRFPGCENIETIHYTKGQTGVMPDRVTGSGDMNYSHMPECIAQAHLSSVDFAEGITHIGDYAFYCNGVNTVLKSVKLPSTLESIGKYAFHNQTGLTDMVLPAGIKSFGDYALSNCRSLQDFTISDQVTGIGVYSFAGCPGLKAVTFNPSIASIPEGCFSGCTGLTELVIPDTVTALGNYAFRDCTGLKELTVPVDLFTGYKVNEYGGNDYYGRFPGCKNIETIHYTKGQTGVMPDRITESGDMNYSYMPEHVAQAHLSSVDFAEGITHIGDYAFYGSGNVLKSVTLPSTLESVGPYAFHNQTGLTDVNFAGCQEQWDVMDIKPYNEPLLNAQIHCALTECPHSKTVVSGAVEPTCTKDGYTGDTVCAFCGKLMESGSAIPALGHSCDEGVVTLEPTEAAEGVRTFTCTRCGETRTETIPVLEPTENPFSDVPEGKFYYDPVLWAISQDPQITTGVTATTFMPDRICTRAHVVTFLWRANGCPEPANTTNTFKDVPNGKYYTKAVLWAAETGITTGYSDGTFRPDAECTRGQVVTFLWRAKGMPTPTKTDNPFADVPAGKYYTTAVFWALENNITTGRTKTTFDPDAICTRGHVVTFLYRAYA